MSVAKAERRVKSVSRRALLLGGGLGHDAETAEQSLTIASHCLTFGGVACRSCDDACPERAIRFRPKPGGHYHPELDGDLCTSCLECVPVCPVQALVPSEDARHV